MDVVESQSLTPLIPRHPTKTSIPSSCRITRIPGGHSNAYLATLPDFAVLVDAGSRPIPGTLKRHLAEAGLELTDLRVTVLTPSHDDHVCEAGSIRAESGARVVAHAAEKDDLARGYTPFPHGTPPLPRLLSWAGRRVFAAMVR